MKQKTAYTVHYGNCSSSCTSSNWNEAQRFIKYLLDNGERVKSVTKETYSK